MTRPLITLTSDFQVQSVGVGQMHALALNINPEANVIHLKHGIPSFDIVTGARTLETISKIQIGYHVCVVDPGVGTKRREIIIQTNRGDYLIGPDNGVLIPATRMLGGIKQVVEITNKKLMNTPVSDIFHGRDIFTPAAAHLSKGIEITEFGKTLKVSNLVRAPYREATIKKHTIQTQIISVNKFGSIWLNITHVSWDKFDARGNIIAEFKEKKLKIPLKKTFGEVSKGNPLIFKDDYNRMEIALNQESFSKKYSLKIGDKIQIRKT